MGLLKSINDVPGIDYYEYRDGQYYNKYDYRLRIKIPCVRYAYWCKKPEDLDDKLQGKAGKYYNVRKDDKQTVTDHLPALKAVVELQNTRKKKNLGLRVEGSTVAVFGNDLAELQIISDTFGAAYSPDYTQVQTSEYAGIKYFVAEPKHKYRVYLKSKRVEDKFPGELEELIKRVSGLYPSPALQYWIKSKSHWHWKWASASHFIDYDDESTLSYLALMHGDMLGKKYKLEKRPEPV